MRVAKLLLSMAASPVSAMQIAQLSVEVARSGFFHDRSPAIYQHRGARHSDAMFETRGSQGGRKTTGRNAHSDGGRPLSELARENRRGEPLREDDRRREGPA